MRVLSSSKYIAFIVRTKALGYFKVLGRFVLMGVMWLVAEDYVAGLSVDGDGVVAVDIVGNDVA